jgi:hypothetical protein
MVKKEQKPLVIEQLPEGESATFTEELTEYGEKTLIFRGPGVYCYGDEQLRYGESVVADMNEEHFRNALAFGIFEEVE